MILTLRLVTKLTMMSLLVVRPTFAQRRSSPLDSTKTATVRRLLELTNAAEAIGKVMEATASVQRRADRDLPDAVWDVFLARARQTLPQLIDSLIPVYTARFSQAELDQLVQFYASPVGQHLIQVQPDIFQERLEIGRRSGERIVRELRDSLGRAGGEWPELAAQAKMKSDLRNLIVAEEAFFADSVKYTTTIGVGGLNYQPSPDNRILMLRLTKDGWVATIGSLRTKTICAIFVGSTPMAPAALEGEPLCQQGGTR